MRAVVLSVCALLPATALASPRLSDVSLEREETEVRLVVAFDPPSPPPAHLLVPDDLSVRLRLAAVETEAGTIRFDDHTLLRVRVAPRPGRTIVRLDPTVADIEDLMARTSVESHPRGLAVVITRSLSEVGAYRRANGLPPLQLETEVEPMAEVEDTERRADDGAEPSPEDTGAAGTSSQPTPPSVPASRESAGERSAQRRTAATSAEAAAVRDVGGSIRSTLAVIFIVFLAGGAWWIRRRGRGSTPTEAPAIDVVAAKRIGPRQSLLLVDVGGKTLLLGATEKGMVRLADLDDRPSTVMEGGDLSADPEPTRAMPATESQESGDDGGFAAFAPKAEDVPSGLSRSRLAALDRELKAGVTGGESRPEAPDPDRSSPFHRNLTQAFAEVASSSRSLPTRKAGSTAVDSSVKDHRPIRATGFEASQAVEGLLRLRGQLDQSEIGQATPPVAPPDSMPKGANGNSNGKEMSLAALESLLVSRQPH